jgi:hypothetical protein
VEIDTSFNVAEFERQARKGEMTDIAALMELIASKMPKHVRELPKMQEWVTFLSRGKDDSETDVQWKRRRRYKLEELFGR